MNIRIEDVSRERSIFLEEEYQKSIMRAKENGVRRKFTEIRPGCSPNASVKSPRLLPQYLPPVIRTEIRPMSFDCVSNVPANEVSAISVDSNVFELLTSNINNENEGASEQQPVEISPSLSSADASLLNVEDVAEMHPSSQIGSSMSVDFQSSDILTNNIQDANPGVREQQPLETAASTVVLVEEESVMETRFLSVHKPLAVSCKGMTKFLDEKGNEQVRGRRRCQMVKEQGGSKCFSMQLTGCDPRSLLVCSNSDCIVNLHEGCYKDWHKKHKKCALNLCKLCCALVVCNAMK